MDSITLLDGGTTATTGGSNVLFNPVGKTVVGGRAFGDSTDLDLTSRREVVIKSRAAQFNKNTGMWSKQKSSAQFTVPYSDANGVQHFSLIRVEIEVAPEHMANVPTIIDTLREMGAQCIVDSEMDNLWNTGAI